MLNEDKTVCHCCHFLMTILSIISITTREITHSKNETILTHASQKHIDKMVETAMKKGDIPGLAILIIKDNKIFLNKGYGYANIEKSKGKPTLNLKLHPILKLLQVMQFYN